MSDKDRFGDKLRDREKAEEDRYFAEQDRDKLSKLKEASIPEPPHGLCPRCGVALEQQDHHGVSVDACTRCGGVWLDRGELEQIEQRDEEHWPATWFRSVLDAALPQATKKS